MPAYTSGRSGRLTTNSGSDDLVDLSSEIQILIAVLQVVFGGGIIYAYIQVKKLSSDIKLTETEAQKVDSEAQKVDAEAAEIIGRTWSGIVSTLRHDLDAARSEIKSLKAGQIAMEGELQKRDIQRDKDRRLIRALQRQVAALRAQLVDIGHEPYKIDVVDEDLEL